MQNRVPIARSARPGLPEFTPVPRVYRHDGWTPERQKAFIEALADTGCVSRAAAMVNMAQANCYTLRRAPEAESFRRAWEAALDFGVQRLKDIAFERAIEGQLTPVFKQGRLMGFSRKKNDQLLMFCLRHYGRDANGKRTTINYFSTRAGAVAGGDGEGRAVGAQASTTTLRTVISGGSEASDKAARDDEGAAILNGFEGVALDAEAHDEIARALEACAARSRADRGALDGPRLDAIEAQVEDPACDYVPIDEKDREWWGTLEPPVAIEESRHFTDDESDWTFAGAEIPEYYREALERMAKGKASPAPKIAEVKKPRYRDRKTKGSPATGSAKKVPAKPVSGA